MKRTTAEFKESWRHKMNADRSWRTRTPVASHTHVLWNSAISFRLPKTRVLLSRTTLGTEAESTGRMYRSTTWRMSRPNSSSVSTSSRTTALRWKGPSLNHSLTTKGPSLNEDPPAQPNAPRNSAAAGRPRSRHEECYECVSGGKVSRVVAAANRGAAGPVYIPHTRSQCAHRHSYINQIHAGRRARSARPHAATRARHQRPTGVITRVASCISKRRRTLNALR